MRTVITGSKVLQADGIVCARISGKIKFVVAEEQKNGSVAGVK